MEKISIKFSKSFLLKDYVNAPDGGGIYFHYLKTNINAARIIYVGECLSFKIRQEEHYLYYKKNKYSLFEIENGELYIKFIPDYDLPVNSDKEIETLKKKIMDNLHITCGHIQNPHEYNLKGIEGAIIIQLLRRPETRKYLLNTKVNYLLRDTEILFKGMDANLLGIQNKIITPST
jgi:hypothetical protein